MDQVDVMRHYGHERFLVAAHDRGARVAHRLCLDHPDNRCKSSALWTSRLPSRCIKEPTNKFATKYMWWFFLI